MHICTLSKSQVSEALHISFSFVLDVSRAITSEPSKSKKQTSQHLLGVLRGLAMLDFCSEGTWLATSPHDTAKGIACETRSEPLPLPASLHGCRINTKSKTCLLIFAVETIE